jgi:catechol 2,3-dioxygenase-like lactoylglutathione lyase family enzyme
MENFDEKTMKPLWNYARRGIDQIAIVVEDVDRAVQRYYELFGIEPWHFYTYKKPLLKSMTYHGQPADYAMRIALSYFGSIRIELIQPLRGSSVYADFVREHGYGVHHIGFIVPDMQQALMDAQAAGLQMTMDGAGYGLEGDGHYAYLDTEKELGVTVEFIQRPQWRVDPEKIFPEAHK